ncbi:sulfatase family protein [Coraliomargarita akajimensis]|uniref:Sulfatase n=1 Tax=Coraliomargarita akajimensis (strain DSM 45221 / IAM 15411 / JCM 23193 / KCTC 12865 / 04OKA010-24) TaxID=583355 RepID=D5ELT3_CORAD|nr:sulfatase-like hydrolase/transferase [Coraliomargarita akajimensis]ADE53258.1 sulfatase [Coraliomargarita akajimensis DSM 45221]
MTWFRIQLLATFACALTAVLSADERPNILIILADDLGYSDLGYTGSTEIESPVIDKLANNGVIFANGYVTHPYCGPSRAGLITGRHQARFGMEINATYSPFDQHMGLPVDEPTFAKRLQPAGYRTGIIGKWHLGAAPQFHPNNRGFDYFYGFLSGGHDYFPESVNTHLELVLPNGKPNYGANEGTLLPLLRNKNAAEFDDYLTTALSKDAARFVTSSEQPFCLYLAYNAPHTPLQAPKETIAKYSHIKDPKRRIYAAMIDEMDAGIGLVVDALEQSGKLDNTLIFFLSDNGGCVPQAWDSYSDFADNGPFKDGKTSFYEGGTHVPFIAHWPAKLKPQTYDNIISSLDLAATAVALAGGDDSGKPLDGVNLIPFLTGETTGQPHEALFWRARGDHSWCVRTPRAKYLYQNGKSKGPELYNMEDDPYEQNNVVADYPEVRAQLAKLWNEWNAQNIATNQMHAYEYQELRLKMYEDLAKKVRAEAAKKTPKTID